MRLTFHSTPEGRSLGPALPDRSGQPPVSLRDTLTKPGQRRGAKALSSAVSKKGMALATTDLCFDGPRRGSELDLQSPGLVLASLQSSAAGSSAAKLREWPGERAQFLKPSDRKRYSDSRCPENKYDDLVLEQS